VSLPQAGNVTRVIAAAVGREQGAADAPDAVRVLARALRARAGT
jgi:hypothetical protein